MQKFLLILPVFVLAFVLIGTQGTDAASSTSYVHPVPAPTAPLTVPIPVPVTVEVTLARSDLVGAGDCFSVAVNLYDDQWPTDPLLTPTPTMIDVCFPTAGAPHGPPTKASQRGTVNIPAASAVAAGWTAPGDLDEIYAQVKPSPTSAVATGPGSTVKKLWGSISSNETLASAKTDSSLSPDGVMVALTSLPSGYPASIFSPGKAYFMFNDGSLIVYPQELPPLFPSGENPFSSYAISVLPDDSKGDVMLGTLFTIGGGGSGILPDEYAWATDFQLSDEGKSGLSVDNINKVLLYGIDEEENSVLLLEGEINQSVEFVLAPPLKQKAYVYSPHYVDCKAGLTLLVKTSNNLPACVNESSTERMTANGWSFP